MVDRTLSDPVFNADWAAYYEKTGQRPPRSTLIRALDAFNAEGRPEDASAIDLGCGSGRDTIEILRRGWPVLAVDASQDAFDGLLGRGDLPAGANIETQLSRYEDMALPLADLINAGFSLPLRAKEAFPEVLKITSGALSKSAKQVFRTHLFNSARVYPCVGIPKR